MYHYVIVCVVMCNKICMLQHVSVLHLGDMAFGCYAGQVGTAPKQFNMTGGKPVSLKRSHDPIRQGYE